jgi:hypothetical protein
MDFNLLTVGALVGGYILGAQFPFGWNWIKRKLHIGGIAQ